MPSTRRWTVSPRRTLMSIVLGIVAVFIICASAGAGSWVIAALGLAVLAAGVCLYVVSALNSREFAYVPGTANVQSCSPPPASASFGRCTMQLIVHAPGADDVAVKIRETGVPVAKWPHEGSTLPILVAIGDRRRVRVLWENVRSHGDVAKGLRGEELRAEELAPESGGEDLGADETTQLDDAYLGDLLDGDYPDGGYPDRDYPDRDYPDRDYPDGEYRDRDVVIDVDESTRVIELDLMDPSVFRVSPAEDDLDAVPELLPVDPSASGPVPGDSVPVDEPPGVQESPSIRESPDAEESPGIRLSPAAAEAGGAPDLPGGGEGRRGSGDPAGRRPARDRPAGSRPSPRPRRPSPDEMLESTEPGAVMTAEPPSAPESAPPRSAPPRSAPPRSTPPPSAADRPMAAQPVAEPLAAEPEPRAAQPEPRAAQPEPEPRAAQPEPDPPAPADPGPGDDSPADLAPADSLPEDPVPAAAASADAASADAGRAAAPSTDPRPAAAASAEAGRAAAPSADPGRAAAGTVFDAPPVRQPTTLRVEHVLSAEPAVPAMPRSSIVGDLAEDGEISDAYLTVTPPPGQPEPGGVRGVSVTLFVSHLGRSVAFYRDVLGFVQADMGLGSAVLESGDCRVELRRVIDMDPVDRRLVHLMLEVPDVQAAYEGLRARGIEFVHRPRAVSRYDQLELWSAAFRDPDGHGIALIRWDLRRTS